MKRQAITLTIIELQDLIVNLSSELTDLQVLEAPGYGNIKFQINIVNPTPEQSDTWRLEDTYLIEQTNKKKGWGRSYGYGKAKEGLKKLRKLQ